MEEHIPYMFTGNYRSTESTSISTDECCSVAGDLGRGRFVSAKSKHSDNWMKSLSSRGRVHSCVFKVSARSLLSSTAYAES